MSIRDQIVEILTQAGGCTSADLAQRMRDAGMVPARNEPSNTLNALVKQGRVTQEGNWPGRTFHAVEGWTMPAHAGHQKRTGPRPPRRSRAKPAAARAPEPRAAARPAMVIQAPAARPASEAAAPPATWMTADDLQLRLAEAILQHLQLEDTFTSAEEIARDLAEERQPVALAIALLMRQGRVTRRVNPTGRWVYRDRRPGDAADAVPAPDVTDPAAEPAPVGLLRVESTPGTDGRSPLQHRRLADLDAVDRILAATDRALGLPSLPGAIRLELCALEDLLGEACDNAAPHAAIKCLAVAHGSLRRALDALAPAAQP